MPREGVRRRAEIAKKNRCKTLICVLEFPKYDIDGNFNIGTTMRNCCGIGVGSLYIICDNPQTWQEIRTNQRLKSTSMSSNKWMYTRCFSTTEECIRHLRNKHYKFVVTSPYMKGKANYQLTDICPLYTTGHLAVWFGNETHGVSNEAVAAADGCISIPMNGGFTESFNLGCATGIVMYHIANVRKEYSKNKAERKVERTKERTKERTMEMSGANVHNMFPPTKKPRL